MSEGLSEAAPFHEDLPQVQCSSLLEKPPNLFHQFKTSLHATSEMFRVATHLILVQFIQILAKICDGLCLVLPLFLFLAHDVGLDPTKSQLHQD